MRSAASKKSSSSTWIWVPYMSTPNCFSQEPSRSECLKGLIYLALSDPQELFQQHLMIKEEQPSFGKRYSVHFGEESAMLLFAMSWLSFLSESISANLGSPLVICNSNLTKKDIFSLDYEFKISKKRITAQDCDKRNDSFQTENWKAAGTIGPRSLQVNWLWSSFQLLLT